MNKTVGEAIGQIVDDTIDAIDGAITDVEEKLVSRVSDVEARLTNVEERLLELDQKPDPPDPEPGPIEQPFLIRTNENMFPGWGRKQNVIENHDGVFALSTSWDRGGLSGSSMLVSNSVKVDPGGTYSWGVKMMCPTRMESLISLAVQGYSGGVSVGHLPVSSYFGGSQVGHWEDCTIVVPIPLNVDRVSLKVFKRHPSDSDVPVDVSDPYFGEGISYANPPSQKKSFKGNGVDVSSSGMFYVEGKPFPIIGAYPEASLSDYSALASAGFNTVVWAASLSKALMAAESGMKAFWSLSPWTIESGWAYRNWESLRGYLQGINREGLANTYIGAYLDHEKQWENWSEVDTAVSIFREEMPGLPVYFLEGQEGAARIASGGMHLSDVVGTYASGSVGTANQGNDAAASFFTLSNLEGQVAPTSVAQWNNVHSVEHLKELMFAALSSDAKGCGIYKGPYSDWLLDGVARVSTAVHSVTHIIEKPVWTWTEDERDLVKTAIRSA